MALEGVDHECDVRNVRVRCPDQRSVRIDLATIMLRVLPCAALIALLIGCGSSDLPTRDQDGIYGGVFNFNESQVVRSIFPLTIGLVSEQHVASQIYEGLVQFNATDLSVEPALAESWSVDPGLTIYEFKLRRDVRFHDDPAFPDGEGRLLTAKDVVNCFAAICEKGKGDAAFWLFQDKVAGADAYYNSGKRDGQVSGITALDEHTVRITLTRPCPNFLQSIAGAGCWIWPQELLDKYGDDLFRHAIGTGPFRLNTARPEEVIVLERNHHYWGKDAEGRSLPYLDAVRVTLVPDKEKEITEFLKGRLSMVTELSVKSINVLADSVNRNTGERRFNTLSTPALAVQFYGFNASKPPFNDVRIRRAFALALDRRQLVDSVLFGLAVVADHGLVPPGLPQYPYDLVPGIPYDPDSARKLMAQAGYPDGKGFPRIQLQVNNYGFGYRSVASRAQEMLLKELGVAVTVSTVPAKEYYERIDRGEALFWREGWVADLPDPENFLALIYGKNAVLDTSLPSSLNTTRYADPKFDALFGLSLTKGSETDRMQDLARAEALAIKDVPLIPLYHERYVMLLAPRVKGMQINPMELLDLRQVHFGPAPDHSGAVDTNS